MDFLFIIFGIIFLLTGLFSGFIAGLLGVGGGIIIVPITYFVLLNLGYNTNIIMHVAIASSLGVKTVNSSDGALLIGFSEDFGGAKFALQKAIGPSVDVRGSSIRVPLRTENELLVTLENILTRYKVFRARLERMV